MLAGLKLDLEIYGWSTIDGCMKKLEKRSDAFFISAFEGSLFQAFVGLFFSSSRLLMFFSSFEGSCFFQPLKAQHYKLVICCVSLSRLYAGVAFVGSFVFKLLVCLVIVTVGFFQTKKSNLQIYFQK